MTSPGNFAVKCPSAGPFGAACGPAPLVDHAQVFMPNGVEPLEQMGLRAVLEDTPSHVQQEAGIDLNGREIFRETLRPEMFSGRPPIAISQPAFLEGVVRTAERSGHFTFERGVAVRSLRREDGRVTGVTIRYRSGGTRPSGL